MSMASAATVPFLFLTMPQILKNASLIAAGRPEALAAIAWQGQVAGLLGNLLLLSYFADKGELSASVVQGVGVCATGALLTQITLAGHIPAGPFVAAAAPNMHIQKLFFCRQTIRHLFFHFTIGRSENLSQNNGDKNKGTQRESQIFLPCAQDYF